MEVYQEQLSLAIPRLTKDECELVCPTLATSQLMPDVLRRSFLERCAQVDAGSLPPAGLGQRGNHSAAPDIAQYQREAEEMRRREKHFRNLYVIEASVRKETFSFFSSLPAEVRTHLVRPNDRFVLLGCDGVWETRRGSQATVDVMCQSLPHSKNSRLSMALARLLGNCFHPETRTRCEAGHATGHDDVVAVYGNPDSRGMP